MLLGLRKLTAFAYKNLFVYINIKVLVLPLSLTHCLSSYLTSYLLSSGPLVE